MVAASLTSRLAILVGLGFVAFAVGIGLIWLVPRLFRSGWESDGVKGKDLASLENDLRGTIAQLLSALAVIAALFLTWSQIRDARRASDRTLKVTEEGQITDRFSRSIDQIGSVGAEGRPSVEVRLGGIYSLGRIATSTSSEPQTKKDRLTIVEILAAYIRKNASRPRGPVRTSSVVGFQPCADTSSFKPRIDIDAVLGVLRQITTLDPTMSGYLNLSGVDLRGANLSGMSLESADFSRSQLAEIDLADAHLKNASLAGADLRGACLIDSHLNRADLSTGPTGSGPRTNISQANLVRADVRDASFRGAIMRNAFARGMTLSKDTDFEDADLKGASLAGSRGAEPGQFTQALTDKRTQLPR